ncbi:PP2C family protein-serine/threonine phosphatase [Citreimonas salinaria]|uniref:Sigma-B regulation protein RsbU (Phosphoserine phosphatase) n=1 Tax=Citreimonas salinaria TaxID=321339 RepID=A0A1H3FBM9_9RHOB|nr:SpoIIE family protein phosphatase [Citreimonas salinaria]SDX88396.1 sigma-B regulation protein RsbU (phosphoserine phosphatase) [Citreimonas salinaria]
MQRAGPSSHDPKTDPAGRPASVRHVLIVDDSRVQLRILRSMLERWGFAVAQAESGEQAIEACLAAPPDIVISDWMMPGMSGVDLCRAFRDLPHDGYGYFILLSAKTDKAEVAEGLDAGADDFLSKPVNAPELRARLSAGSRVLAMERALSDRNRQLGEALDQLRVLHAEIDRDLKQARTIQQALVPERSRLFGTSRVSLLLQPCGHVGGDLVGMFSPGTGRLGMYGIDVSGHGITSAMVTARVAGYLSSRFPDQNLALERRFDRYFALHPPEVVAEKLNRRLAADPGVDEYLTMAYVTGDLHSGEMRMVQAGHPPPILLRADGEIRLLGEGGLPIGLVPDVRYDQVRFDMAPGDRLLIYSDGFTEARMRDGSMLEEQGLVDLFRQTAAHARGEELLHDMFWRLRTELVDSDLGDDVSAALLEFDALSVETP